MIDDLEAENQELEVDRKNLWVQIDPYYYLTTDTYNPVILVRFSQPNRIRNDQGELLTNRKWYFSNYQAAIKTYLQQAVVDDGRQIKQHNLTALKEAAQLVDSAIERGVQAVAKFDQARRQTVVDPKAGKSDWDGHQADAMAGDYDDH